MNANIKIIILNKFVCQQFDTKPNPLDPQHGLVFSSFVCLFQMLSQKPDVHFVLKASFLEIYNEKVSQ